MKILTFGELMLRLTPNHLGEKLKSCKELDVNFAGSESNVASSLGELGHLVSFVSKLPLNDIGYAASRSLQNYGIDTRGIRFEEGRIGTYFIEIGSSIRPSKVIYDRENSVFSKSQPEDYDWDELLKGVDWIFASGITAALSSSAMSTLSALLKSANKNGVKVAFDMNYRRTLWKDANDAKKFFEESIPYVDLLFGNQGFLFDLNGESFENTEDAIQQTASKYSLKDICFTERIHHSASKNELQGFIYSDEKITSSKTYTVEIKDRFGTGDAFAAGCLHGYINNWSPADIINFGTAAFALKHTIIGDQHTSSENEIIGIVKGQIGGHVIR